MRQPVQFGLHKRNQLFERSLVSAAPVTQQLGDFLLRWRRRRHTGCSTLRILTRSRDFYSLTPSLEYLAQSWSVLSGISALGGRSTFMSERRNRGAGQMSQLKRKILKTTNLIKDFGSDPKIVKFVLAQKGEKATLKRGLNVL